MKRISREVLRERAHSSGLARADACVLSILGYWSQVPGGVVRDHGPEWKWRTYAEMAKELAYSISTIQRAVESLRRAKLIETKRMFNPSRSGTNVNGFRLTLQGYELLGLDTPEDATDCSEKTVLTLAAAPGSGDGNQQDDWSLEHQTHTFLQKTDNHGFGKVSEATNSAPSSPASGTLDWDVPPGPLIIDGKVDCDDW